MRDTIKILGVKIDKLIQAEVVKKIEGFLKQDQLKTIYTPNTEIVMEAKKDETLKNILNDGDIVIPDGIGLIYAAKIKKKNLPERVTGCDISFEILDLAQREGYSIFLLGGKEGVAKEAGENLKKDYPNIKLSGVQNGYFKGAHMGYSNHDEEEKIIKTINNSGAEILFVGLGAPKQEIWINENKEKLNCKLVIGNGGTVDILAGRIERAPEFFQKLGLEWLYRLIKDPKRIKRQMVIPLFILTILFSKEKTVE